MGFGVWGLGFIVPFFTTFQNRRSASGAEFGELETGPRPHHQLVPWLVGALFPWAGAAWHQLSTRNTNQCPMEVSWGFVDASELATSLLVIPASGWISFATSPA